MDGALDAVGRPEAVGPDAVEPDAVPDAVEPDAVPDAVEPDAVPDAGPTAHAPGHVDVVSFDVGKHNMAVCAARVWPDLVEVRQWEIVDVNGATMRETCRNVMGMLEARPWVWRDPLVHVVVEQQTQTNAPMRVLQHVIQVLVDQRRDLAGVRAPPVTLIPARSKYEMVGGAIKGGYAANKRNSVAFARGCDGLTPEQLAMFEAHRKRDDLSDALMQGVWYARRRVMAAAAKAEAARARVESRAEAKAAREAAKAQARAAREAAKAQAREAAKAQARETAEAARGARRRADRARREQEEQGGCLPGSV